MANNLESVGHYLFEITRHNLAATKNGYPQAVLITKAVKKWAEDPAELSHFNLDAPGWVDWSSFNEAVTSYFVLCNNEKQMLSWKQFENAIGWQGASFNDFDSDMFVGKKFVGRVEINSYNNRPQVTWVDPEDYIPGQKQIKELPAGEIAKINQQFGKFLNRKTTRTAIPKPVAPKAKPPTTKPTPSVVDNGFNPDLGMMDVWNSIDGKPGAEEAWTEVLGDRDATTISSEEWGKIQTQLLDNIRQTA